MFRPPPLPRARGQSETKGGRRLSGRICWNFPNCAFAGDCKYVHPVTPHARAPAHEPVTGSEPLKYMLLKAHKQLGPRPEESLLVAILEQDGVFAGPTKVPSEAHLFWGPSAPSGSHARELPPGAIVNHFPNTAAVTHKHLLVGSLRAMGSEAEAVAPRSFLFPAEEADLEALAAAEEKGDDENHDDERRRREGGERGGGSASGGGARWIVKRAVGGEGRGSAVAAGASAALKYARADEEARCVPGHGGRGTSGERLGAASHVVQRLVPRPLCVGGLKADLRVYVLVTSWGGRGVHDDGDDGVRAYVYEDGLVRFASDAYDAADLSPARHLTNNALCTGTGDKNDAKFMRNWSLARLRAWLDDTRGEGAFDVVWDRTKAIAAKVVEAAGPSVREGIRAEEDAASGEVPPRRRFSLLGLDVLVDDDLRAWLLEVNSAPSLTACSRNKGRVSETHHALKAGLIADLLNLVDAGGDGGGGVDGERKRAALGKFVPLRLPSR